VVVIIIMMVMMMMVMMMSAHDDAAGACVRMAITLAMHQDDSHVCWLACLGVAWLLGCWCADVSRLSSRLVEDSKKFRWNAKKLNLMDAWKKYAPFIIVALIVVLVLWWRFA